MVRITFGDHAAPQVLLERCKRGRGMIGFCYSLVRLRLLGLLAVLIVFAAPMPVLAQNVIFRNECRASVIVQSAVVVRGVIRRERPYLLNANAVAPKIALDTDKIITVYDAANPNRVLFQGPLMASPMDLYFSIVPDVVPNKVRMVRRPPPTAGGVAGPGMAGVPAPAGP
jgi:hypothetical protein